MKFIRLCLILILFLGLNSWGFEQKLQINPGNHYSPISKAQTNVFAPKTAPTHPVTQMNPITEISKVTAIPINVACVFAVRGTELWRFNDMAYTGLLKAEVDGLCTFINSTPTSESQYQTQLDSYAAAGIYDLIIAVGFAQAPYVINTAAAYPTQAILMIDEIVSQGNVSSIIFEENEGSFLAGALAGLMTQTGKIGFIGGIDTPIIRRFWSGYKAGALYEKNRSYIEVVENFVGGWDDSATGKAMAEAMWAQGVDIIYAAAGKSGLGVLESANEQGPGFYAIGVDGNQDDLYPGRILTSMMKRVDIAVYKGIRNVYDGTWNNDTKYLGLAEDGVGISPMTYTKNTIGSDKIQEVNVTIRNKIISGELTVPKDSTSLDQWITDMGIITGPISISSNSEFSSLGFPGAGTSKNPYRIEGFNLIGSSNTMISISGTTDNFIINNNRLKGLSGCYWVINLHTVIHGTIENNIIEASDGDGIALYFSDYNRVNNNTIMNCNAKGIRLENTTDNNKILYNTLSSNGDGIWIGNSCENNTIIRNEVNNNNIGIALTTDSGVGFNNNNTISQNIISNNLHQGIRLDAESDDNNISYNLIINNDRAGISIGSACDNNIIHYNDFSDNYPGSHQATDQGVTNIFANNYWNDWDGTGSYSFDGNDDASPQTNPNHLSAPDITAPTSSIATLKDSVTIQWKVSSDTFGHPITYSVFYSTNDETTWNKIVSGLTGTSYDWDLSNIFNGTEVLLKVEVEDSLGFISVSVSDSTFIIENPELISTTTPTTTTTWTEITPAWTIHLVLLTLFLILPLKWIKREKYT